MNTLLSAADVEAIVRRALKEDLGSGDLTALLIPSDRTATATVITREAALLCGRPWFDAVFAQLSPDVSIDWKAAEGARIEAGQLLCQLSGPARALLSGERTALNFLQTLSATATAANRYVDAIAGTGCEILDTRKTLPGLRLAQKYATRCGGARNHRLGLYDAVLIKENHIAAAGSIGAAIANARKLTTAVVEIEVETLGEFAVALQERPDIIMLDEFSLTDLRTAVQLNKQAGSAVKLEASGSVNLNNVRQVAETGVDYISIGSITKHVQAVDLSMRFA